jgi:hypothetical protein
MSRLCCCDQPRPFWAYTHSPLYRRLIGRRFEDPVVKKDIESWPFKVVDQGGNPVVEVEYLGETKTFSPQEISSMVLVKVKISPHCMNCQIMMINPQYR